MSTKHKIQRFPTHKWQRRQLALLSVNKTIGTDNAQQKPTKLTEFTNGIEEAGSTEFTNGMERNQEEKTNETLELKPSEITEETREIDFTLAR